MPDVKDDLGGLGLYGWVFSGFFLASLVGTVLAGELADRQGLVLPFVLGLVAFGVGLVVGGLATSMPMLIAGRLAQGIGAGAIPATGYASIGRGYPAALQPRVFAVLSTAWVVPGLVGPAAAVGIEHAASWRWVFLALLPLVVLAGVLAVPALAALDRAHATGPDPLSGASSSDGPRTRVPRVLVLVVGVGAVFSAGSTDLLLLVGALLVAGVVAAGWAFRGLVPPGTLRLAPGVPATVAIRGVLTFTFFAADAYVPLAITDGRGAAAWVGGLALSVSALAWAIGSWVQARFVHVVGPRRLVRLGLILIVFATVLLILVTRGSPVWVAVAAWAISGAGMGLAYAPLSLTVLGEAAPGEEGTASAALILSDALGIAVGTGAGGWIVALADGRDWPVSTGTAWVFALAGTAGLFGLWGARRLPSAVPAVR